MNIDHSQGTSHLPVGGTSIAAIFYTGVTAVFAQSNPSDLATAAIFLGSVASVGMMLVAASRELREWTRPGSVRPLPPSNPPAPPQPPSPPSPPEPRA